MNVSSMMGTSITSLSNATIDGTGTTETGGGGGIVSDDVLGVFIILNFVVLCSILFAFGSIANVVNFVVFFKIGFKDPVNISLLALALSDFGSCFSLLLITLCYNPLFQRLDLPFDPADFHFLISGWVHITFARITSCITAFITFERCLCVTAPLKVKEIITPKRVTIFLVCMTTFVLACISPIFYTSRHVWEFHPERNKTILVLVFIENSEEIDNIAFAIHSIVLPIATFFVVVFSTALLVLKLKQKTKWRENVTKTASSLSTRDAKVSQMVVMIATLFIVCFIPIFISFTTMLIAPEYNIKGRYRNVFLIMFSYHFTLESTNSSMNIFIYYRMSSNYCAVFLKLFGRKTKDTGTKNAIQQSK